ncbi:DUF4209 domain-containing protein [Fulvimonas yonginensis]|uniref:DUF4209 domain-containing protein n=1 Tax=Fulvimonas yonginensis TaxID=1495200 RepID=A0ABU8JHH1_9GAMM
MNMQRYPEGLVVTQQDFADSGWREALADGATESYSAMWRAFSAAARTAIEAKHLVRGKVLWLLADACSMMLRPKSISEPYQPIMVIEGKRSATLDDFAEADIFFFSQIVDDIDDVRLRARIADVAWLLGSPREVKFALTSIDAYRLIPLDAETWVRDGRECWERAIGLARMLRAASGERLQEMEATILAAFEAASCADGFLILWLAELLESNRLGRSQRLSIAQKLESSALEFDSQGDLYRAGKYWQKAAEEFEATGDRAKAGEMKVLLAENAVKEAGARVSSDDPSHMVAANFYEEAIQTYRTIPRSERAAWGVDERIVELRKLLQESGEKSVSEMSTVHSPQLDITALVERARDAVRGKTPLDALRALANLHPGANAKQARDEAIATLRKHPLQAFFSATTISRDGRVVARRPGMSFADKPTADDEIVIRTQMINDFQLLVGLAVQGEIVPALEVILMEHRLREMDFVALASRSPIVPPDRAGLFGKALFAGYDRDLATAIHLLIPQIEQMVRFHFKQAGIKTTILDGDGIETEFGLSTLMGMPEAEKVFGANLTFELSALLCDAHGPNLRNELAHGLMDEDACRSVYVIYIWWLALKLVFNAYWLANRKHAAEAASGEEE